MYVNDVIPPDFKQPLEPCLVFGNSLVWRADALSARSLSGQPRPSGFVVPREASLSTMQSRNGLAEVSLLFMLVVGGVGGFVTPLAHHQKPNPLQQQQHDHAHSTRGLAPAPSSRRAVALCRTNSRVVRVLPLSMNGAGGDSQVHLQVGIRTNQLLHRTTALKDTHPSSQQTAEPHTYDTR